MTIVQAIILGTIQGITEFLPISSSGHLIIVPAILGWEIQDLSFDVALHFGTALAVLIAFRSDWLSMFGAFFSDLKELPAKKNLHINTLRRDTKTLLTIGAVTIPVAIAGLFLEDTVENFFRSPTLVAYMLIIISFVMLVADFYSKKLSRYEQPGFMSSLVVSLSQILALVPGTSRSGISISTGMFMNLSRTDAARLSFLLATPLIVGAAILKIPEFLSLDVQNAITTLAGFLTSLLVGLLAIKWLLKFLEKHGLLVFVAYRIVLGILLLILFM